MQNILTIDVEDYFQVSAFEKVSPPSSWSARRLRVEENTDLVLAILKRFQTKATFFILGWIAERCPQLVQRIAAAGHEIASHGYGHQRVYNQTRAEFREDLNRAKKILEDLTAGPVLGYRAPSYSLSPACLWAFDELQEAGFKYDSSVFPIRHDFYGMPDWPRFATPIIRDENGNWFPAEAHEAAPGLLEIPITTLRLFDKNLPIAGGGYHRRFELTAELFANKTTFEEDNSEDRGLGSLLSFSYPLGRRFNLDLTADWATFDYQETGIPDETVDRFGCGAGLSYELKHITASLSYNYRRNNSDDQENDYTNNIVLFQLSWKLKPESSI